MFCSKLEHEDEHVDKVQGGFEGIINSELAEVSEQKQLFGFWDA